MKAKILIADDEEACRELIQMALEPKGYKVIEARDGEEALRQIAAEKPDLVLLDIHLPKRDGISVLKEVRKNSALSSIRILAFSAQLSDGQDADSLANLFDGILNKPVNIADLRRIVDMMSGQE